MNAQDFSSAGLSGFGVNTSQQPQQQSPLLPVVNMSEPSSSVAGAGPSSAPSHSASGAGSGSTQLNDQNAGPSSSLHASQLPAQFELGLSQSQSATSPTSTGATGTSGPGYLQRSRRRWTADEDAKLISAVKAYGSARGPGSAWSLISQGIPGRTNKDCRKRWFHSLDPSVRKGKWSPTEDDALRRLYSELGPQWKEIALRIPGRKDDQVSKRWRDVLAPELTSKKPWSSREDTLLLELLEKLGPRWTAIADKLPGRSPIACRNRSRKFRKQRPEAMADDTPSSTGASGSGSGGGGGPSRSGSGSGVASAGPSIVPLPPMGLTDRTDSCSTLPSGSVDDEPDWRIPADLNTHISVSSFNFDLNQPRLDPQPPGTLGTSGPAQGQQTSAGNEGPPGGVGGASGPNMMGDNVMGINASPAVGTSALPISHEPMSPATHLDQSLPQMDGGWMQPAMQMSMPMFDRAVDDMWDLFVALDRGDSAVLVDSNLLRQLVAGAASGLGHTLMPGRA